MAYNEQLSDRIREIVSRTHDHVEEKKMFGGLCFMINDKMSMGVMKDKLMVRVGPDRTDEMLEQEGCRPIDFTGKAMKGYVYVDEAVLSNQNSLEFWVGVALEYNAIAPLTKKKK